MFERSVLRRIEAKQDQTLRLLRAFNQRGLMMSKEIDDLTAAVAAQTSAEQSAITLIQGLAAQISAASSDPAAVEALASQITTNAASLAAAVTANTASPSTPAAA